MKIKRLTERNKDGEAYFPACFSESGCGGMMDSDCSSCDITTQICERLAAYEDLGVTPERIRAMDSAYLKKCIEVNKLKNELEKRGGNTNV